MGETYYERLNVPSDAPREEIAAAYRERLKETHPDVSDERDAKERTKQLIEAKEVLTDEKERSRYDRLGHEKYVSLERQSASPSTGTAASTSHTSGTNTTTGTQTKTGTTTGTQTKTGATTGTQSGSAGKTSRGNGGSGVRDRTRKTPGTSSNSGGHRAGRANWYSGTSDGSGDDGNASSTASRQTGESNTWRAWNTGGSYAVHRGGDSFQHGKIFSSTQAFVMLGVTFLVYPVLVFGALYPPFPLSLRLAIVTCGILLVAFLQSIPEVGIVVFGVWSLLLPLVLVGTTLPVFAVESTLAMVAVLFPFGLSILTRIAVRPMSV